MTLRRYRNMKASGALWLGYIPSNWQVKRLKHLCAVFPSNVDKKTYEGQLPVKLCNYTDVYYNEEITADLEFMSATATPEQVARFSLRSGDSIVTKDSETSDDIAVASYVPKDLPGVVCGYHLAIVRPWGPIHGRYVKRLFDSKYLKSRFDVAANGLTRVGLSQYALDNVEVPLPPRNEQNQIVAFLERETQQIDALVRQQERLIELLKEKRQAVVSHAVTKGLNPEASLRPSGIEWIGEVPEHWEVGPVKRWFITISGGTPDTSRRDEYYAEQDGFPWIRTTDLNDAVLNSCEIEITDAGMRATVCELLPPNSVLVAMYGGEGTVGKNSRLAFSACINQAICGLLPCEAFDARFTHAFMQFYRPYWMIGAESSRKDPNISQHLIRNSPIVRPPLREQASIAEFLEKASRRFDELAATAQRAIQLLAERRSALISAAVTGQIDVRELEPAEFA